MVTCSHRGSLLGASVCSASSGICLRSLSMHSASLQCSFCYYFSFRCITLFSPGKGKLLKASKILYSEKIFAGRKRSGSYDEMFQSLARPLSHLLVTSLYMSRDLWSRSLAWSWHLSLLSPGQLGKLGQVRIHWLSHLASLSKIVLTLHVDSIRFNIISWNANDIFQCKNDFHGMYYQKNYNKLNVYTGKVQTILTQI